MVRIFFSASFCFIYLVCWSQNAEKLFDLAKTDYYNFQYTSAIQGFEQTKDHYAQSGNTEQELKSHYFLLMSHFELGNTTEALDNLFDGADIAITKYGDSSPVAADFYIGYGKFYHQKASYDTAKMFYRTALELKDEKREPIIYGEIYANLGYACDYKGEYDSALIFYQKATEFMEAHLGIYHPYTQWIYASIPYVANQAENYEAEVKAAKKSLDISMKIYGENNQDHLTALRALAVAYEHNNQAGEQKKYFERCLDLSEKIHGQKSEDYATALTQLGNAYSALNDVESAVKYNIRAYELRKKLLGEKHPETLDILRNIGNVYLDGGRYQSALSYYEENLDLQQKLHGKKSVEVIQPLEDVAQVNEYTGKFENALEMYHSIVALKKQHQPEGLPSTYIAIARVESHQSKEEQALVTLDEALLANLRYNQGDLETEAFIKNNIGTVYRKLGEYPKALDYLNDALEIRTKAFGEASAKVAQVASNIGSVLLDKGKWDEAEEYFLRVLEIEKAYYGADHPQLAGTYMSLASVESGRGRIQDEITLLRLAEKIFRSTNGPDSPKLVSVYNNITIAYLDLVRYDSAQYYCDLHKELSLKLYGKDSQQNADNFNLQGMLDTNLGRIMDGFENYKRSIDIYETIYSQPALDLAAVYNNLGLAYYDFNEYVQAQDYLDASLRIYQKIVGEQHSDYLSTLMNLGLVAYGRSDYHLAMDYYERSTGGENTPLDTLMLATIYQNWGLVHYILNERKAALDKYKKAIKYRQTILGENSVQVAELYQNCVNLYITLKDYQSAINYAEKAQDIYQSDISNASPVSLIKLYLSLSNLYAKQLQLEKGMQYANKALKMAKNQESLVYNNVMYFSALIQKIDIYYLHYANTASREFLDKAADLLHTADQVLSIAEKEILNDEDRIAFSGFKSTFTVVGLKNAMELYKLTNEPRFLEEAFYYSERSKSNVLIDAIREQHVKKFAGLDQKLVDRERELSAAIQNVNIKIFKLSEQKEPDKYDNLRNQLFDLNREYDEVVSELRSNKRYQKLQADYFLADLTAIRQSLGEDEAAVEIAQADSTLYLFLLTKNDLKAFDYDVGRSIDTVNMKFVQALQSTIAFNARASFNMIAEKLYNNLIADLEAYLKAHHTHINTLAIVPEGYFYYVPFEVLRRNDRYLIEDYNIRYSYSLTLSQMLGERAGDNQSKSLLGMAPVFDEDETNQLTSGARAVFNASTALGSTGMRGFTINGQFISALPGTKTELEAIGDLMKENGYASELFYNGDANEQVIKSGALDEYQFIHFATHGFVNDMAPDFSGVFLSQNADSEEDCILFASEVYGIEISADLVTLSACETGLGEVVTGEGLVGLTRAFLYAGANSLLVSQWKVNDASTARMMVDFYRNVLAGSDKAKALRAAKLALINSEDFNQPYYWAPFILIGK